MIKVDYYSRHMFCHVLCHAISSKKSSPLDRKYFDENDQSSDDHEESETDQGDTVDEEPEEDNKHTSIRKVTRRRRRSKSKTTDTEMGATSGRSSSLRWAETMMLLSPVSDVVEQLVTG